MRWHLFYSIHQYWRWIPNFATHRAASREQRAPNKLKLKRKKKRSKLTFGNGETNDFSLVVRLGFRQWTQSKCDTDCEFDWQEIRSELQSNRHRQERCRLACLFFYLQLISINFTQITDPDAIAQAVGWDKRESKKKSGYLLTNCFRWTQIVALGKKSTCK